MKIYMMTDLEGVAGVTDFEDRVSDSPMNHHTRRRMQKLLTGEVNAAVDALFRSGATEVIVNDGHGAGFTIDVEVLDPRAQIVHGLERPHWLPLLDETCHAAVHIGCHAKASTPRATAYHTMNRSIKDWSINGISIGEMGALALIAGSHGVPLIYVSGDHWACREMAELIPGIVTTTVKKGLSRRSAVSWPPQTAREMIRRDIPVAIGKRHEIRPFVVEPPLVLRDERFDEAWPKARSTDSITYLAANLRELHADSVPELLNLLYGYDVDYHETSLQHDQGQA